jgi:DNA-binding MarR family transcriptional regulator
MSTRRATLRHADESEGAAPLPGGGANPLDRVTARARYMMGESTADWSIDRTMAWEGLLEVAGSLRREAESRLQNHGDLSVSALGVMGRLATAELMTLRQAALAEAMGLSVSRVSRIIDLLERRDLVTRAPCPVDGRATNVSLTGPGLELTTTAQHTIAELVERRFFARLSRDEVSTLAAVFGRLLTEEMSPH